MGAIIGPEDVLKGREWMLKKAARDLSPSHLEQVEQLLKRWDDKARDELFKLIGEEKAKRILQELGIQS